MLTLLAMNRLNRLEWFYIQFRDNGYLMNSLDPNGLSVDELYAVCCVIEESGMGMSGQPLSMDEFIMCIEKNLENM